MIPCMSDLLNKKYKDLEQVYTTVYKIIVFSSVDHSIVFATFNDFPVCDR